MAVSVVCTDALGLGWDVCVPDVIGVLLAPSAPSSWNRLCVVASDGVDSSSMGIM